MPKTEVRVLRLLEYVYPNQETAEADMANWGVQTSREGGPPSIRNRNTGPYVIRSAVIREPWSSDGEATDAGS